MIWLFLFFLAGNVLFAVTWATDIHSGIRGTGMFDRRILLAVNLAATASALLGLMRVTGVW